MDQFSIGILYVTIKVVQVEAESRDEVIESYNFTHT